MLYYEDLNTETLVSRAGQLTGTGSLSLPRGNVTFGVQFCQGSTLCAAPAGTTAVWFGVKAQADMQGPWLANAQLQPIAGSTGLYQSILQLNTAALVALMHADPADPVPELLSVPVYGQFYYFLPGQTTPNTSQVVTVNVTAVLWNGAEGIAPSPNTPYPPAASVATKLVPTAIKTAAYTASAGDLVRVDASAGNVAVTLPTGAADGAQVGVKLVKVAGGYAATVLCGGTAVLNIAGGNASGTLSLLNQGLLLQYDAADGLWIVITDDLPLSGLDGRYAPKLAVAAIQTANAALVSDTLVPFNCTAGNLVATMPANPTVGMRVAVKKTDASANTLTITAPFDGVATPSALVFRLQSQGKTFVYDGTSWWAVYGDLSLPTLDARYPLTTDTRFPANVTGLRKGAGAGSLDAAAVPYGDYLPGTLTQIANIYPSLNYTGTAGSTIYAFAVIGYRPDGSHTAAYNNGISTGAATLGGGNSVTISWTDVGCSSYAVFLIIGSSYTLGKVTTVAGPGGTGMLSFVYTGQGGDGTSAPYSNTTGGLPVPGPVTAPSFNSFIFSGTTGASINFGNGGTAGYLGNTQTWTGANTFSGNALFTSANTGFGPITGGTYNGNINVNWTDGFMSLQFRSGTTIKSQIIGTSNPGGLNIDIPYGLSFRSGINGNTTALMSAAGVLTITGQTFNTTAGNYSGFNCYTSTGVLAASMQYGDPTISGGTSNAAFFANRNGGPTVVGLNLAALGNGPGLNIPSSVAIAQTATTFSGPITASAPIKPGSYTISTLPSASSTGAGYVATVSNPASGKSNVVYCNGTNYLYADGTTAA